MIHSLRGDKLEQWDSAIVRIEFAYNSSVNNSIGMSPFLLFIEKLHFIHWILTQVTKAIWLKYSYWTDNWETRTIQDSERR